MENKEVLAKVWHRVGKAKDPKKTLRKRKRRRKRKRKRLRNLKIKIRININQGHQGQKTKEPYIGYLLRLKQIKSRRNENILFYKQLQIFKVC